MNEEIEIVLRNLTDRWPEIVKLTDARAKIYRQKYLSFIEAGFTPEQALTLCSKEPLL